MMPALHPQQRMLKEHMTVGGVAGRLWDQGHQGHQRHQRHQRHHTAGPYHKNICRAVLVRLVLVEKDTESEDQGEKWA
jgi:hypothetical protein